MYNEIPSKNFPCRARGERFFTEWWESNEGQRDRKVRGANVNCGKYQGYGEG